jgi:siroheme synthase
VTLGPAPTGSTVTSSATAGPPAEPVTLGPAPTGSTVTSSDRTVSLVGAGPGDPDLVTLRAEALLAEAATVVADAGVVHLAAAFAPRATIIVVPDRTPAVDALLAAARDRQSTLVRLYTGDTWLHPAHGPESSALRAAGIEYEAVAGVAVEVALPALAGIPVHVRQLAVACTIADDGGAPPATDPARTLVVAAPDLRAAARSMAATGDPSLPAAAIEATGATTRAPLGDLADGAPERPGLVVTGAVVATRQPVLR